MRHDMIIIYLNYFCFAFCQALTLPREIGIMGIQLERVKALRNGSPHNENSKI